MSRPIEASTGSPDWNLNPAEKSTSYGRKNTA